MIHSLPIAPVPISRRGACPSLDTPMQTGDGLLARVRVLNSQVTPSQLGTIAMLALKHGNGLIEITARGNLQARGLRHDSTLPFAQAVQALVSIARGLVVETPPLAGSDPQEIADPRPLAQALRLIAEPLADRLGPKVTVVVDGGGQVSLASLKSDVRLVAVLPGQWSVSVGDAKSEILPEAQALEKAASVLRQLADLGPTARAADLFDRAQTVSLPPTLPPIGSLHLRDGGALGIALPFGTMPAMAIKDLCTHAAAHGVSRFCLAPHHALIALGASGDFALHAEALGFLTALSDPRLRISACAGSQGCASGLIPARSIAAKLAYKVPPGTHLHVSGCAKGCAHPGPADTTFVGLPSGLGLVINGSAGDSPEALLQADQLESALAAR